MVLTHLLNATDLVLGSQSPRRAELMHKAGFTFRTWAIPIEEHFPGNLPPEQIALYLANEKAQAFKDKIAQNTIVITADTIVVKDGTVLNKAMDRSHAFEMLSMLSATVHEVITGVCITSPSRQRCFTETTKVFFNTLTDEEIFWYIDNYSPFDKAGAYGIQEWIGLAGVKKIEGCFYNVVGLPIARLYKELKTFIET